MIPSSTLPNTEFNTTWPHWNVYAHEFLNYKPKTKDSQWHKTTCRPNNICVHYIPSVPNPWQHEMYGQTLVTGILHTFIYITKKTIQRAFVLSAKYLLKHNLDI